MNPTGKIRLPQPSTEADLLAAIKADLKAREWFFYRPVPAGWGGMPALDIFACCRGFFVGIECKKPGKKPTALQAKTIQDIRNCGGFAFWCDSFEMYTAELEKVMENLTPYDLL